MQKPHERLRRKIEKENLWLFVLSVLEKNDGLSGAEIRREVVNRYSLQIGNVTSYKILYLLERGGYVRKGQNGGGKLYFITHEGREELKKGMDVLKHYLSILEKQKPSKNARKQRE